MVDPLAHRDGKGLVTRLLQGGELLPGESELFAFAQEAMVHFGGSGEPS
ncbi:hypothetical protein CNE_BB1p06840 (plasmid) [Cupriavidus necator N-1]|uniref:Uncharacterized protein n=1 Tax=Cupriavidus necator (strain ATCC 43291 / DSM 13513 / CCUG 52238 / LMG 8453 / N-1) TaxID=1042878 RepID=F8GXN4_CUPNN|nr:hypothetical protein CNE_BB1p06840 [Cupriavidus necator N-1]